MVSFSKFLGIFIIIFTVSCETIPPPECIGKGSQPVINWGEIYHDKSMTMGYSLDSNAQMYKLYIDTNFAKPELDHLNRVSDERYCRILSMLNKEIIKVQALNVPGTHTSRFIEYIDNSQRIKIRSVWNPEFQATGSKGFRVIYDSLNALIGY